MSSEQTDSTTTTDTATSSTGLSTTNDIEIALGVLVVVVLIVVSIVSWVKRDRRSRKATDDAEAKVSLTGEGEDGYGKKTEARGDRVRRGGGIVGMGWLFVILGT